MAKKSTKKSDIGERYKDGGHKKLFIGLAVIAIIIVIAFFLYETYGSLPSGIASALQSGKQLNAAVLQGVLLQKVDSYQFFSAQYSGNITINSDPAVVVSIAKANNSLTYKIGVADLPNLGNLNLQYNTPVNGSQQYSSVCVSTDNPQIAAKLGTTTNFLDCQNSTNYAFSGIVSNLLVNSSSLQDINIASYGVSSYSLQPCYSVDGSGIIDVNSTIIGSTSGAQTPMNLNFTTCLSAQYNIPLYLNADMKAPNGASILINISEKQINTN